MRISKPNSYKVKIENCRCQCIEANGQLAKAFVPPDTADDCPKLYVVKQGEEVIYVGITKQDIRKRLRYGMTAGGEHGYSGYKWKHLSEAELLIWTFARVKIENVEAIEGEVVYFIRNRTGKWPTYQMEIHFHPGASEGERQIARSILRTLVGARPSVMPAHMR